MLKKNKSDPVFLILMATVLSVSACSTLQPPDPNGPRSNAPPYPVVAADETNSQEDALLAWRQLAQRYSLASTSDVVLDPVTATVKGLPADHSTLIYLPKVGVGPAQTEEEIRESLRRFIDEWRSLIGAEPDQLSLVEHRDESANIQIARYQQRPFRYALRGDYGKLVIRFNKTNRQVIELASNCLRNADRLQASISNLTPKVTPEDAVKQIKGKPFSVTTTTGQQQTFSLGATEAADANQLVIYAMPSRANPNQLELHLAWEIDTPNSVVKKVYLDAVSGEIIAVSNEA
ncbi:MAG TPA: hypothetical protein VLA93_21915 [Pyrinomonadaceae bacterium]|nr:hypothetical protein [Pyrinomonadaceae bacterium]